MNTRLVVHHQGHQEMGKNFLAIQKRAIESMFRGLARLSLMQRSLSANPRCFTTLHYDTRSKIAGIFSLRTDEFTMRLT